MISCVNAVGVEVNTASVQLLSYVSGLGPALARNIVKYRDENGPFQTREDLKKVSRLGAKAFEQAAGFPQNPGMVSTPSMPAPFIRKAIVSLKKWLKISNVRSST